jgi:hypothetical protein
MMFLALILRSVRARGTHTCSSCRVPDGSQVEPTPKPCRASVQLVLSTGSSRDDRACWLVDKWCVLRFEQYNVGIW